MNQILEIMNYGRYVSKLYERAFEEIRIKYGMTQLEIDILAFLKNNPEMDTASDIVRYRMLPKANVSQAVELLIRKRFLSRSPDGRDRRRVHLVLNEEVQEALREILRTQKEFMEWLFQEFTQEEQQRYMEMTFRITLNIKNGLERMQHGEEK